MDGSESAQDASTPGSPPTPADLEPGVGDPADSEKVDVAEIRQTPLERRRRDGELIEYLRGTGFRGAEYDRFQDRLVRYGLRVLDAWLRHGQIFERCSRLGRGVAPSDWERNRLFESPEDREDLAASVVGVAIMRFRDRALVNGGWQLSKGASVTTYFMNCVIREFPNQFRAWQSREKRWKGSGQAAIPQELWLQDPGEIVAQKAAVVAELRKLGPGQREIVALYYDGYSVAQIAELEQKSTKAVERVLERWRDKQRQLRAGDGDGRL